jgi:hypothetical protein
LRCHASSGTLVTSTGSPKSCHRRREGLAERLLLTMIRSCFMGCILKSLIALQCFHTVICLTALWMSCKLQVLEPRVSCSHRGFSSRIPLELGLPASARIRYRERTRSNTLAHFENVALPRPSGLRMHTSRSNSLSLRSGNPYQQRGILRQFPNSACGALLVLSVSSFR